MEQIDILDKRGRPTGEVKPRTDVHRKGDWHRTVHVWVVHPGGDVLFQKRSLSKESFPGRWDVSAAGHISASETSANAAVKELYEELGIRATASELRFLFSIENSSVQNNGVFVDNEFSDVYLLRRAVSLDALKLHPQEVSEAAYFPKDTLLRLGRESDDAFTPHSAEYARLYELLISL